MFTRFKQNVRTYPHVAAVVGCLYLGAILIGAAMVTSTKGQILSAVCAVLLVAFVDFITYIWVMSDPRRLAAVLEMLDDLEGRRTPSAFCPIDEINEESSLIDDEEGQDVAEYAVMLAVMLVIVIGVVRLVGGSANTVFSQIGSKIQ